MSNPESQQLRPQRFTLEMLETVFDLDAILDAVRRALVDHAEGQFVQEPPMHLTFPGGDCHIKAGYPRHAETFSIKVATGFYNNDRIGLPNNNGLQLLASQQTGIPVALFEDRGFLTAWRTAAATVLAAQAGRLASPIRLGIVGAGQQAQLAAAWLPKVCRVGTVSVWGRNPDKTRGLVSQMSGVDFEPSLEVLCRKSNLIVTTTPAAQPLVQAEWVQPGTHIVALGADNPGKNEIDPLLFARCATIMTDDHSQCVAHGDFGVAVRAGSANENADVPLGKLLRGAPEARRTTGEITIADLTGLAAQDHAIASLFYRLLSSK